MKIKSEALFGAAACGIVIAVIYTLADTLLGYSQSPPSYTAFGQAGSCFIVLLVGLLTGVVYVLLHQREQAITPGAAAKGGAAAGGLALLISGIFGTIVLIILLPVVLAESFSTMGLSPELASDAQLTDLMTVGFLISTVGATCGFVLIGAVMGAVGGVTGAAIFGSKKAT